MEGGFVPQPGSYYLAWDIRVLAQNPRGAWRVLVDAVSGHVLQVIDLSQYASGTAKVFDPNPIVTSGDTTLRHGSAAATINGQRASVSVEHLDAPSGGNLRLRGSFVRMQEEEAPSIADPANSTGTLTFVNASVTGRAYDVVLDGAVSVTALVVSTESSRTVAANVAHAVTFRFTGTSTSACSTSNPIIATCGTSRLSCSA